MKNVTGGELLKQIDSTALQNSIINMDIAYKIFRRIKLGEKKGFPKFKSKHDSRQSYQSSTSFIKDNHLYLPKIGLLKAKFHRGNIVGKIKTVTVSFEANQYFASINYEDNQKEQFGFNNGKTIGIDLIPFIFQNMDNRKSPHLLAS